MHTQQYLIALAALVPYVCAHGVITAIHGANNVTMPGLSITDGTPRDCATPGCGAEADTTVFRGDSPLGKTVGSGTVDAAKNIQIFMSGNAASASAGSSSGSAAGGAGGGIAGLLTGGDTDPADILTGETGGVEGQAAGAATGAAISGLQAASGLLGIGKRNAASGPVGDVTGLLTGGDTDVGDILTGQTGGLEGQVAGAATGAAITGLQAASGLVGIGKRDAAGVKTPQGTSENLVGQTAGSGATSGLPTADENGIVTLTLHQVNQDGAGPFQASIDSTSGGQTESAFQDAQMVSNVGGIASLSAVTTTDFPVQVQVPQGTVCSGTVAGVKNVCIVRIQNNAIAGPFGGSAAFTQSAAAKKRAVEYLRIKRSRVARADLI
ncbi:hypothetical protein ANO11243_062820 [Dothideomycetidae sp. 11243]|nr:hypothetical protein ANO11243_062820 [fungal sp. No.11243]